MWQSAVNPVAALTPSVGLRQVPHPHEVANEEINKGLQDTVDGSQHAMKTLHGWRHQGVHDNEELKKGLQDTVDGLGHAMQGLGWVTMAIGNATHVFGTT